MEFSLRCGSVDWVFRATETGVFRVVAHEDERTPFSSYLPTAEVAIRGRMTCAHMGGRHILSSETGRWRYVSHTVESAACGVTLTIVQESDIARLTSVYFVADGTDTVRIRHKIENIGENAFTVEYIGTFGTVFTDAFHAFDKTELWIPTGGSYCECQWNRNTLKGWGVFSGKNSRSTKKLLISNVGTWSTKNYLPMGVAVGPDGRATAWQIEANGSWSYELGDLFNCATLHLNGPTFDEHNWQQTLHPGESFETVAAAVTEGVGFDGCMRNLTRYRRALIGDTEDAVRQPIVFNEYMYASWNSPSAQTAAVLAPVAAACGADYYVIDCGWHDEPDDPFYYIGRWKESAARYPEGLKKTCELIRECGLGVGLWMEPEVVGAKGDAGALYDDACYFSHGGARVCVSNRYQLDFRNKRVTDRLDRVIDGLIADYGVVYFKFDYNIEAGVGTDCGAESCGQGLLEHNRAVIAWLTGLKRRHPQCVIENCASGGNRMDYLTMRFCDMQSTSDQIEYRVYPYIAANMFTALLPEQAAVWAYPAAHVDEEQPDAECVIMNMVNGMAGRMHLASRLDLLSPENKALVKEATEFYATTARFRRKAVPYFEGGVPTQMDAGQVVYGLEADGELLLFVYRMNGDSRVTIRPGASVLSAETVYPKRSAVRPETDGSTVTVEFPQPYSARVLRVCIAKNGSV